MALDIDKPGTIAPPRGIGFKIRQLDHGILQVSDLMKGAFERSWNK